MKNLDRIERYINHEMDEDELWEFRKALDSDPQLAEEYAMVRAVHISSRSKANLKLMETMEEIRKEQSNPKLISLPIVKKRTIVYAASFVLLLSAGILLWHMAGKKDFDKIFQAYYQPEPVSFAVRSATLSSDQPVMFGLNAYQKQEYTKAIAYFNQSPSNPMGQLYNGLSNIALGQYQQAIVHFKTILEMPDNLFNDQAAWFLALCYLKTNQQNELKDLLNHIASGRSIYKTKALKLLNELGFEHSNFD